jgi:hypothetical protein
MSKVCAHVPREVALPAHWTGVSLRCSYVRAKKMTMAFDDGVHVDSNCKPWTRYFTKSENDYFGYVNTVEELHRLKACYEDTTFTEFVSARCTKNFGNHGKSCKFIS